MNLCRFSCLAVNRRMSDFSFLAVPNIEGMRRWWYIQILGIVIFFGICLFFTIYFLLRYRRRQKLFRQFGQYDQQAQDLGRQLLIDKIRKSSGKTKLILFIEYLEKFVTTKAYAKLPELLSPQRFTHAEATECEQVLYTNTELSKHIETKIDEMLRDKFWPKIEYN